jgi:hypothetical protein
VVQVAGVERCVTDRGQPAQGFLFELVFGHRVYKCMPELYIDDATNKADARNIFGTRPQLTGASRLTIPILGMYNSKNQGTNNKCKS